MNRTAHRAFSLLELIVVIAIIGLIASMAVPVVGSVARSARLNQATQIITDQLAIARQTAIGRNHAVEVRFFQFADPDSPGSKSSYRALQTLEVINGRQMVPLDKVQNLPISTIADHAPALSSLLDPAKRTVVPGSDPMPRISTGYQYTAIRFRPDGSTDLLPTEGPWFLTLHDETAGDGLAKPPQNFTTIEIDPVNGSLKFYHPGL